mgnify:CR=1 FL=1
MDSEIEKINALIGMGKGDVYRLEHIKSMLEEHRELWNSDRNYLDELKKKYFNDSQAYSAISNVKSESKQDVSHTETSTSWSYCNNCGNPNPSKSHFCNKCGNSLDNHEQIIQKTIQGQTENVEITKKPRKKVLGFGIFLLFLTALAYIVPINDLGWSLANANDICKGPLGMLGQAFGGRDAVNACSGINSLMIFANFLGIIGFILVIVGAIKRK